ncbi:transmembrane 74 [Pelobates cultripes]|uniref:Transmembrane 74 n=1 Tax=Pelobates cultripes TaxID=61616 RepID=A0AAD1S1D1_PELCU|nr:transmembrane 74 [Pelobates cultripes]
MELLHITGKTQRLDECNNVDWSYSTSNNNDIKTFCYENYNLAAEVSPDQYETIQLEPTLDAPDVKHLHGDAAKEQKKICCLEELETSFTYVDENVNIELVTHPPSNKTTHGHLHHTTDLEIQPDPIQDASLMFDDDALSEASGKSVDYGFISAVTFLVTGILLVIISYLVPRDIKSDPNSTTAREMEQLEKKNAIIGGHLDRCVIAGLCLLTLGGVVLSILLMISMWKGEIYRRKTLAAKESSKLYGSINFNQAKTGGNENVLVQEDTVDIN